jgi:hypothetical protein
MNFLKFLKGLFINAKGIRNDANVERRFNRRGVHSFSSARERALSDICRARMLLEAQVNESGGNSNSSSRDTLCDIIPTLGELISKRTGESEVYWKAEENAYYKIKNPAAKAALKHSSSEDWVYEHVIHNILFPETAYELIGVTRHYGELRLILKQANVSSESLPSDQDVDRYLRDELGLVPEDRYWYGNDVLAVTDVGSRGDNVLVDDCGHLFFIDPLIRLKKSALEVIEWLVGPVSQ